MSPRQKKDPRKNHNRREYAHTLGVLALEVKIMRDRYCHFFEAPAFNRRCQSFRQLQLCCKKSSTHYDSCFAGPGRWRSPRSSEPWVHAEDGVQHLLFSSFHFSIHVPDSKSMSGSAWKCRCMQAASEMQRAGDLLTSQDRGNSTTVTSSFASFHSIRGN